MLIIDNHYFGQPTLSHDRNAPSIQFTNVQYFAGVKPSDFGLGGFLVRMGV